MEKHWEHVSLGQRWNQKRPTKMGAFWLGMAVAVLTMVVGFTWGGWVVGSTARAMAEAAVLSRLTPICVAQFQVDPGKVQKLKEWSEINSWERGDYVKKQGWATMPGEKQPDTRVAEECARLLVPVS